MTTNHTLLNVVRSQGPGKSIDALLIDNLETKHGSMIAACGSVSDPTNFYNEDDFDIGKTICIAGKLYFVCKSRWPRNSFGNPDEFLRNSD